MAQVEGQSLTPQTSQKTTNTLDKQRQHLRFLPFYKLHRNRYGVYFDKFTQSEWDAAEAAYRAEEARLKDLEARTVDHFVIGQMQPERDHKLRSERNDVRDVNGQNIRTAMAGGWFDFEVKVDPVQDHVLVMTYWGNDRIAPDFEVLVDGVVVASETLDKRPQNKFFDVEYTIPSALTKGKATVVVKIQPKAGKSGPSVTGARIARKGEGAGGEGVSASCQALDQAKAPGTLIPQPLLPNRHEHPIKEKGGILFPYLHRGQRSARPIIRQCW